MIKNAIIIGVINVMLGIAIAVTLDLPTGPSIIITALILFIVVNIKKTIDKFL
jgi:ABC-type Mn2+/Zn2+ transport system permease subunit